MWLRMSSACRSQPVPHLLRAGSDTAVCTRASPDEFECVKGQRLHNFTRKPVLVFDHLHLMPKQNFMCISLCPFHLVFQCAPQRTVWLHPHQVFMHMAKIFLSLLLSRLSTSSSHKILCKKTAFIWHLIFQTKSISAVINLKVACFIYLLIAYLLSNVSRSPN